MTTNTRLFQKSLLAVTVALASSQAMAAGFQLNAQSATGLGRAFAGDAVIADNASVMARNPAAMALFDETSLSLGFVSITSQIEVKDSSYAFGDGDYDDAGGTSVAPNMHLIVPINEKFAVGVNAYSNFGTKTEFSDDYAPSQYGGLTDVKSFNFGLAGSYRVNDQWSFGAGLDLIYGQGKLKRTTDSKIPLIGGKTALDADADGWAVGFNLGTVYELDENNRFGLAYHHSPELKAKGDVTFYNPQVNPLNPTTVKDDTLYMPLPDMIEFSGFHKITDTKFAVHYSVQWIEWSSFDTLDTKGHGTLNEYNWQNAMHFALGGTYYLNKDWTLRAGYMYDTSAQNNKTSISVPDSDRNWLSTGFTYHIDQKSNVDFGFTYLIGKDVDVTEGEGTPLEINATTRANAILVGLQYSRSF